MMCSRCSPGCLQTWPSTCLQKWVGNEYRGNCHVILLFLLFCFCDSVICYPVGHCPVCVVLLIVVLLFCFCDSVVCYPVECCPVCVVFLIVVCSVVVPLVFVFSCLSVSSYMCMCSTM